MTTTPVVVIGGGEHARVLMAAIMSVPGNLQLLGYTDVAASPLVERQLGALWLGDDGVLPASVPVGTHLVLGVGAVRASEIRRNIVKRLDRCGLAWASVVHAQACLGPAVRVAPGAVVMARAVVQVGASLGQHVVVNTGAVIEHDVAVEDHCLIAPGAVLGGGVVVREAAYVGLGAVVRDHVEIGAGATVGMGAVVTRDVPAGTTVLGNPARVRRSI